MQEKLRGIERAHEQERINSSLQALNSYDSENTFDKLGLGRVREILHATQELHFDSFGVSNEKLRNLIISDESLLNKCNLDTRLGFLRESNNPRDILKILDSSNTIFQVPEEILAPIFRLYFSNRRVQYSRSQVQCVAFFQKWG